MGWRRGLQAVGNGVAWGRMHGGPREGGHGRGSPHAGAPSAGGRLGAGMCCAFAATVRFQPPKNTARLMLSLVMFSHIRWISQRYGLTFAWWRGAWLGILAQASCPSDFKKMQLQEY